MHHRMKIAFMRREHFELKSMQVDWNLECMDVIILAFP